MNTYIADGIKIIELSGDIQQTDSEDLEMKLQSCLENRQINLVLDLTRVTHICSSALGILVAYQTIFQEDEGDIRLVINSESLLQLFEVTMLQQVFSIFMIADDAIRSFE